MMPAALDLHVVWDQDPPTGTAFAATAGTARLLVNGSDAWASRAKGWSKGVHWTWVDLLGHLAQHWPFIVSEQPSDWIESLIDGDPRLLRHNAEAFWKERRDQNLLNDEEYLTQEESIFYFEDRHDLSRAVQGAHFPSLYIIRRGSGFSVSGERLAKPYFFPADDVIEALERIGDGICRRLEGLPCPVAAERRREWQERWGPFDLARASLLTGMTPAEMTEAAGTEDVRDYWNDGSDSLRESAVMALARAGKHARLSPESFRLVMSIARERRNNPRSGLLRDLATKAHAIVARCPHAEPAEQGRTIASELRADLMAWTPKRKLIDPEVVLENLGVTFRKTPLIERTVDAISCWRSEEAPVVIVNTASQRNQRDTGLRAAYAHELCHAIVDHNARVPFAEVMTSSDREPIEKRARGFAAELLMPRDKIAAAFKKYEETSRVVDELSRIYRVSHEIVAWQIRRSNLYKSLSPSDKKVLTRFVSNPRGFAD